MSFALERARHQKDYYRRNYRNLLNMVIFLSLVALVEVGLLGYYMTAPNVNGFYASSSKGDIFSVEPQGSPSEAQKLGQAAQARRRLDASIN